MARILVTDDDPGMREMMSAVLTEHGHTIVVAKTAREALESHRCKPVDVIVTDLVMKEMDGTELLRRLRTFSQTPVIAVSGDRHSTIYLNMAKLLGAERILPKPFSPQDLQQAVAQVLAQSSSGAAAG